MTAEPLDLEPVRRHFDAYAAARYVHSTAQQSAEDVPTLLAEVERLRRIIDDAPTVLSGMLDDGVLSHEDWSYGELLREFERRLAAHVPSDRTPRPGAIL